MTSLLPLTQHLKLTLFLSLSALRADAPLSLHDLRLWQMLKKDPDIHVALEEPKTHKPSLEVD